jgi:hypothetical protein
MNDITDRPKLFGLDNSNKDFGKLESWGKNLFNNAFPVSLACYMGSKNICPVYIKTNKNLDIVHEQIAINKVFGLNALSKNLFFGFEKEFAPYSPFVFEELPRIDLVTYDTSEKQSKCLKAIEIKLTALPDNQTVDSDEADYGCEIVVRPDNIVYLALSVATEYSDNRKFILTLLKDTCGKNDIDWTEPAEVLPLIPNIISAFKNILIDLSCRQSPFLMQPIWKTIGKKLILADNCFDIFIWSNSSFIKLFLDVAENNYRNTITRHSRTVVWLAQMLYQFAKDGRTNHVKIIDNFTYNTKNDKAFACSGRITNPFMKGEQLTKPRIKKDIVKELILCGGQDFLSPERRLDAAILNTDGLF